MRRPTRRRLAQPVELTENREQKKIDSSERIIGYLLVERVTRDWRWRVARDRGNVVYTYRFIKRIGILEG